MNEYNTRGAGRLTVVGSGFREGHLTLEAIAAMRVAGQRATAAR
jgi:hypothetical protein